MEAVIWIGIAAMIVIAAVIAAIGRPGNGPGGKRRTRNVARGSSARRTRSYSGAGAYSGTTGYSTSTWSGDTGAGSCGDSSGGGFGGGGFSGGDGGGSCGGGGGGGF